MYSFKATSDITADEVLEIFHHWKTEGIDRKRVPAVLTDDQYENLADHLKKQYVEGVLPEKKYKKKYNKYKRNNKRS